MKDKRQKWKPRPEGKEVIGRALCLAKRARRGASDQEVKIRESL